MFLSRGAALGLSALLVMWASIGSAIPAPVDVGILKPDMDPAFLQALEVAHKPHLQKRLSSDIDISKELKNQTLFSGSWTDTESGGTSAEVSLDVACVECWTKGTVTAKLTDENIFEPVVRLEFDSVEAYVDLDISMSAGATYAVNLFTSETPAGLGFPGLSIGLVFYVDLVFSLTDVIDLEAGFTARLADDAYVEASIFGGDITDHSFDGITTKSLPITVTTGKATFKADLRLRVQVGAEAEFLGIGAGAELGIYANVIEFVAVLESTPDCSLQATEWWDMNVGAFAHLDVVVDYSTFGPVPTVSTTLLTAPTLTQCLLQSQPTTANSSAPITQPAKQNQVASGYPAPALPSSSPFEFGSHMAPTGSARPAIVTTAPSVPTLSQFPSLGFNHPSVNATSTHSTPRGDELVTSTLYATSVYAITGCAVNVPNCPLSYQKAIVVTHTLDVYTTVCPASANITAPSPTTTPIRSGLGGEASGTASAATVFVTTDVVVLVSHPTPVVKTFSAPSSITPLSAHTITATPRRRNPDSSSATTPASRPLSPVVGAKIPPWASESSKSTAAASAASAHGEGQFRVHETTATSAPVVAMAPAAWYSDSRWAVAGTMLLAWILI